MVALEEANKRLRISCVSLQATAEQEEENISNTLFKRIRDLQAEKKALEDKAPGPCAEKGHLKLLAGAGRTAPRREDPAAAAREG